MTELILIRHGESLGNMVHKFLGHTDLDLSPTGYKQAELVYKYLKNKKIDAIYSSDLIRAYNTIKPTADALRIQIIKSKNLREIYAGDWEGKLFDDLCIEYKEEFNIWKTDIGNAKCVNGESVENLSKRIYAEVEKIARENDGKTVVIATHATPIRCLTAKWQGIDLCDMKNIGWTKNAGMVFAKFSDGDFEIIKKDFLEHLGETVTMLPNNV